MSDPTQKRCPICGQPAVEKHRPFCSTRCADIDLARWLKGIYGIPAVESEQGPAEEEPETPPPAPPKPAQ
jgi:hypothetical protein